MKACTATPSVAPPARMAIITGFQSSAPRWPAVSAPKAAMKTSSIEMPTMLLTTGAQVKGPNDFRALSTSPSSVYSPRKKIWGRDQ